jgi:hypothetical protein
MEDLCYGWMHELVMHMYVLLLNNPLDSNWILEISLLATLNVSKMLHMQINIR